MYHQFPHRKANSKDVCNWRTSTKKLKTRIVTGWRKNGKISSSLCITFPHQLPLLPRNLLFLSRSAKVWKKCRCCSRNHTSEFVQYIADNVDHNIRTLDGNDTFHGMGIIASVIPGTKHSQLVSRAKVNPGDICTTGHIQIQHQSLITQVIEIKYNNIVIKKAWDPTKLDILWKTSLLLGLSRPAWSDMMQFSHRGIHSGYPSVTFLLMITYLLNNEVCLRTCSTAQ